MLGATRPATYGYRWQQESKRFLARYPLCAMCDRLGRTTVATVVDHAVPHRGDPELFWNTANWQSLCAHHHNSEKQRQDKRPHRGCTADGRPRDPNHYWNRTEVK